MLDISDANAWVHITGHKIPPYHYYYGPHMIECTTGCKYSESRSLVYTLYKLYSSFPLYWPRIIGPAWKHTPIGLHKLNSSLSFDLQLRLACPSPKCHSSTNKKRGHILFLSVFWDGLFIPGEETDPFSWGAWALLPLLCSAATGWGITNLARCRKTYT